MEAIYTQVMTASGQIVKSEQGERFPLPFPLPPPSPFLFPYPFLPLLPFPAPPFP